MPFVLALCGDALGNHEILDAVYALDFTGIGLLVIILEWFEEQDIEDKSYVETTIDQSTVDHFMNSAGLESVEWRRKVQKLKFVVLICISLKVLCSFCCLFYTRALLVFNEPSLATPPRLITDSVYSEVYFRPQFVLSSFLHARRSGHMALP